MGHEEYREMLAAAALGTLEDPDAKQLESHLQSCSECRAERDQWEETASWLALDAEPREPSTQFRTELLLKIRSDVVERPESTLVHMPRRVWAGSQKWGAIAAGFLIVGLSVSLLVLWRQNRAGRQELARLSKEVEQTKQELAQQREASAIISTPGSRMMELAGTEMAPMAHAMLAYDETGRAILMAKNLPPPPAGKAYQLWFIAGGAKMPGKVFRTTGSGEGMLNDHVPESARGSAVFAITLEPEQGVTSPTGQIYLVSRS
jgi:anti-sigma-K factor RskA